VGNESYVFIEGISMRPDRQLAIGFLVTMFMQKLRAIVVDSLNEIGDSLATVQAAPTLEAWPGTFLFIGLYSLLNGGSMPNGVANLL